MRDVDVTITYLEMEHPAMLHASRAPRGELSLERINQSLAEVAARFYRDVGAGYQWRDRDDWTDAQWRDDLSQVGTELWIARCEGVEAGFFLLTMPAPRTREILYFGLLPSHVGKGLGASVLTLAVERAWDAGADRVIVNTCTLDHPSALPNYLARGFEVVRTRTERRVLPE